MTDTDRSTWLDRAKPVREALDLERLTPYLQQALGMPDAPVTVQLRVNHDEAANSATSATREGLFIAFSCKRLEGSWPPH